MIRLYESLIKSFETLTAPIRNLWYYLTDFLYIGNPLTKEDRLNFTRSLDDYILSRFDVSFNSKGMILTRKRNGSGLATILNN
jgi:hypothetical protein